MKKIVLGLSILLACSSLFAQNAEVQKGIAYFVMAHNGNYEYAKKSADILKPYVDSDALACAYYGSAQNILAAEAITNNDPIKSLEFLETGGKFLDKAIKMDSKNAAIHLVRLENGIEVSRSSPLKRYAEIKSDVDFLLQDDVISSLPKDIQAEVYVYCGYYLLDSGDLDGALDLFDLAIEADSNSKGGKLAQQMLDKYSE